MAMQTNTNTTAKKREEIKELQTIYIDIMTYLRTIAETLQKYVID
jgi:hypothetical protein